MYFLLAKHNAPAHRKMGKHVFNDTLPLLFQACADQSISAPAGCLGSKVKEQEEGERRLL